jgi:hypothetical protein
MTMVQENFSEPFLFGPDSVNPDRAIIQIIIRSLYYYNLDIYVHQILVQFLKFQ